MPINNMQLLTYISPDDSETVYDNEMYLNYAHYTLKILRLR